jgi:hypothetical protein
MPVVTIASPAVSAESLAVKAFRAIERHSNDIAEWLVDQATDSRGRLKSESVEVDAALGGEDFIPCTMTKIINGRKYRMELFSTAYKIEEV